MVAKFCFFTDPTFLATQSATQGFGPAATVGAKDGFRVADVHQVSTAAASPAKAHAVCRGQVCLQTAGTTLNLILRPFSQPPFDFPYVEYFIYRGLRPDSLVTAAGELDLGKEGTGASRNGLIGYIREKVLKLAMPQASHESGAHIGLDRTHHATATDGGLWGDVQILDHLFRYPGAAELPIVEPGDILGEFLPSFGFEVVVQHYGAQPKIGWVREADRLIEADQSASGAGAAAAYVSRLQREAIGCFVDPCAFWGMFWSDGLAIPGAGTKRTSQLHARLFGASPGIFVNRDRAYLDIRNEVGLSYDFYGTYQDAIQVGPSKAALTQGSYSRAGWPIHYADPAPAGLCFRLRSNGASPPRLFLRQTGPTTPGLRFANLLDPSDASWTSPLTFKRPKKAGAQPPWWFVAHYLKGDIGTGGAVPASGVFDTSPLQFGPIGDRAISAFRQMWPAGTTPSGPLPGPSGYEREFVSDKVLRHDGTKKMDPVDPVRTLAYDRFGETHYVFQKGMGANNGRDSVLIAQRRNFGHGKDFDGGWTETSSVKVTTSASASMFFRFLTGRMLSSPVSVTILPTTTPPVTVASFLELLSDTRVKTEIFDYTILLLSKTAFEAVLGTVLPSGPPPGPGEAHPAFLSLALPQTVPPLPGGGYLLQCKSWNGQPVAGATVGPVFSADGIFFSSTDFDRGGLATIAAPALTVEESDASTIWDSVLAGDTRGATPSVRMASLASQFIDALLGVDSSDASAPAKLLALVGQYAPAIWNRAVVLAGDPAFEPWSDRILYYARLKMGVALKSHPLLLADPETASKLTDRFESLSRNYTGLRFAGAAAGDRRVIVTGFDPFGPAGTANVKTSNPSGRLALYLAAKPSWTRNNKTFFVSTCIFPVRWSDFDKQIVEKTLEDALLAAQAGNKPVDVVCTVSLDGNFTSYIETYPSSILFCKIDGFAGQCRGNTADNLGTKTNNLDPNTLPLGTAKHLFYETLLKSRDLSDYDSQLFMKARYDWRFSAKKGNLPFDYPTLTPHPSNYDDASKQTIWAPPQQNPVASTPTKALRGSGGNYLSNEAYYRSSNLLRSKFTSIKSGHIHVPPLQTYTTADAATFTATITHLADAVVAVISGEL